jgi:hypothetical protein
VIDKTVSGVGGTINPREKGKEPQEAQEAQEKRAFSCASCATKAGDFKKAAAK